MVSTSCGVVIIINTLKFLFKFRCSRLHTAHSQQSNWGIFKKKIFKPSTAKVTGLLEDELVTRKGEWDRRCVIPPLFPPVVGLDESGCTAFCAPATQPQIKVPLHRRHVIQYLSGGVLNFS